MSNRSKRFKYKHFIRRAHRYMGVFIGIQFILWTLGGLYFSWTNLDQIHGDHLRVRQEIEMSIPAGSVPPDQIVRSMRSKIGGATRIEKIYIVELLGEYFYALEHVKDKVRSSVLVSVKDGSVRPEVSSAEAGRIAQHALANPNEPTELTYLTADNVSKHHEYREKPLPSWAVTFANNVSVYVAAETGQVEAIRTDSWRAFDFLWMLHTMDFKGRDNINNYILRSFSVLGLITVLSGFSLFFVSSRFFRRPPARKSNAR